MPSTEIRGDYHITLYPDHETWQINYTDGTLGQECHVTDECTSMPNCHICQRKWSAAERELRYDHRGQMACPDCQELARRSQREVEFLDMSDSAQNFAGAALIEDEGRRYQAIKAALHKMTSTQREGE